MSRNGVLRMFSRQLTHAGHVRRFLVNEAGASGWEVREERDSRTVHHVWCSDWHRVERKLIDFNRRIAELEREGWVSA